MTDELKTELPANKSALQRFWQELRRRKVIRVASVYIVTGWIIIQVASSTFPSFGIPDWAFRFVSLMVLLGLPVALILAWALELTPDGIKTTQPLEAANDASDGSKTTVQNWHSYAFAALLPTLIFGGLAMFFYIQAPNSDGEMDGTAERDEVGQAARLTQSIAVMPLVNMSSHQENEYFAGGIHEDVLTNLARIGGLQVISRTSMLRYATSDMSLMEIGNELGVDYIVEGSVRRIGNHVRVTIQLINAQNDLHLWANNYERELVNEFATQSALATEISDSIHLELQPESVGALEGMPTTSVKAYDLYIRAQSLEKTEGETEENVILLRELLEAAVAEDPNFVEAWAALKRLYDLQYDRLGRRGWYVSEGQDKSGVEEELRAKSRRALRKAITLDPDNVETLLATVVDHVWPKSREEMQAHRAILDQIIAAQPENAKAWYHLGFWHSHLRDFPEGNLETLRLDAAAAFEEALRLDPFNARMVGAVLTWSRNNGFEENVSSLSERLIQIVPETAADRNLARVAWSFKRRQITSAFLETADESLFEGYEQGMMAAIESEDYSNIAASSTDEMELAIFTNDLDRMLELAREPIDLDENVWAPTGFSIHRIFAITYFLNQGELNQARDLAESVLLLEDAILAQTVSDCGCLRAVLAIAHAVTGNTDEAQRHADALLENKVTSGDWFYMAMARIDIERAVGIAFGEIAKNPNSMLFDALAAWYVPNRIFLAHPRVQEYYLNEGKWIDYLAARVPEYAQYKRTAAEQ